MILRTAHRLGAPYEWAHHVSRARALGFRDARIAALAGQPSGEDALIAEAVMRCWISAAARGAGRPAGREARPCCSLRPHRHGGLLLDPPAGSCKASGAACWGSPQLGAYPLAELADDSTYFPATVEEYLNTLAPADHDAVQAALKYEPMIWRLHPHLIGDPATGIQGFLPWLSAERGVTISPEDLDTVFGVIAPPPIYVPS